MSGSHIRTFLHGSAVSILGIGILGVVNYLIRRMLALNLSPADYGTFYSMLALLGMIFGFADLGITQSGTVLIASDRNRASDRFWMIFLMKLGLSLFFGIVILACFGKKISSDYLCGLPSGLLALLTLYMVFSSANGAFTSLWNGLKYFRSAMFCLIATSLLYWLGLLLSGARRLDVVIYLYLGGIVISTFLIFIYALWRKIIRIPFHFDRTGAVSILKMCGFVAVSTALLNTVYNMDTIMLTALKGVESSALYNIALPIMQIAQALMIFPSVFLPIAVEMGANREYAALRRTGRIALAVALLLSLAALPVTHLLAPWLITVLFSQKYLAAANALTILCCGMVIYTFGQFIYQILLSIGALWIITFSAFVTMSCNLVLNLFFIRSYGVEGAALATACSYTVFAVLNFIALECKLKHRENPHE